MPRIPIISSGSQAVVVPAPRAYGIDASSPYSTFQQGMGNLSGTLFDIAARIKGQKDDLEFVTVKSDYDAQIQNIRRDVLTDPTIENPFMTFNERAVELQSSYNITSGTVQRAFQKHVAGTFPGVQQEALNDTLKLQNQRNVARLHELGDELSTTAATGPPELRDQAIKDYNEQINLAEKFGTLNPIQAADAKKAFRISAMTKNMSTMAQSDPYKLFQLDKEGVYESVDPLVRLKNLEFARVSIEQGDAQIERRFREAQDANYKYYYTQALTGSVAPSDLALMVEGKHPYVTDPAQIKTIANTNANPIAGPQTQVAAIMLDYHASSMASPEKMLEAVAKARTALEHYRRTTDRRDPTLDKAFNEIQADEFRMTVAQASAEYRVRSEARAITSAAQGAESQERARVSAKEAEINRQIQTANALYDTKARRMPGLAGKYLQGKAINDKAEMEVLIRKHGLLAEDAFKRIQEKRENEEKTGGSVPSRNKAVIDVVPKR